MEGKGFKTTMREIFKSTGKMWTNFIKPGLEIANPIISAGVAVKTRNPQAGQITSNITKSVTGSKILSFTDFLGNGFRLKVMRKHFK